MLYPVILSGGMGTRLWPLSSQKNPKQFRSLLGKQTLLQGTYQRILKGFDRENIFLVAIDGSGEMIKNQIDIPDKNIFLEPIAKGTAMAIGYSAMKVRKQDKDALIVVINSDHYVEEEEKYINIIKEAEKVVSKNPDKMVLLGITPTYPETEYGYIKLGKETNEKGVFEIDIFTEKPSLKEAKKYFEDKKFLWNPAVFVFKADSLLSWYKEFLPETYQALSEIEKNEKNLKKEYEKVENISIDYGLLEKMQDMLVMPADINWADVGNWRTLRDVLLSQSKEKNITNSDNILVDSQKNLFYSFAGKTIAAVGVEDMILVETDDVILLCPADKAPEIKKIIKKIKGTDLEKYL